MTIQEPIQPAPPVDQPPAPRHLGVGAVFAAGAQIAPIGASAAMSLAIARLRGPSGTGVISLVLNLVNVLIMVVGLGVSTGITYLVSRGEWPLRRARRDFTAAAWALGLAGAGAGLVFYLLARHSILRGVTLPMALLGLGSLPFAMWWTFISAAALGRDRYEVYATLVISNSAGILFIGVALAIAFGLTGAMVGFAGAEVIAAIAGMVWLTRQAAREPLAADAGRGQLRRATSFGSRAWTANLLQLLNYRLDLFILGAFASRASVGVYSVAVTVTALGWVLPDGLQTVLFPRVASLDAQVRDGRAEQGSSDLAAARAVRHVVVLLGPTAVILIVLLLIVPLLYGHGFTSTVPIGLILIPGVVAAGVAKVLTAVTSGRGFPGYALRTTAITVPVTLVLYAALIPPLHAYGAAIASTISYTLTTIVSLVYFRRATAIPARDALLPRRADLSDYRHMARSVRRRP